MKKTRPIQKRIRRGKPAKRSLFPAEIYIAPVLAATRRGVEEAGRRCLGASVEASCGVPPRLFQRLTRMVDVAPGGSCSAAGMLRNHAEFPLGSSVFGHVEIVWFDGAGRELRRDISPPFDRALPAGTSTRVEVKNATAPTGARMAAACVSLYDREREGGSIWVDDFQVEVHLEDRVSGAHDFLQANVSQHKEG